jgi:hypothetical protein
VEEAWIPWKSVDEILAVCAYLHEELKTIRLDLFDRFLKPIPLEEASSPEFAFCVRKDSAVVVYSFVRGFGADCQYAQLARESK